MGMFFSIHEKLQVEKNPDAILLEATLLKHSYTCNLELTMSLVRAHQQFDTWSLTPIPLGYEIPLQHRALPNDPREEEVTAMTVVETSIYIFVGVTCCEIMTRKY